MATNLSAAPQPRSVLTRLSTGLYTRPWLLTGLLFALPLFYMVVIYLGSLAAMRVNSFYQLDDFSGKIVQEFTLKNYLALLQPGNLSIILRTVMNAREHPAADHAGRVGRQRDIVAIFQRKPLDGAILDTPDQVFTNAVAAINAALDVVVIGGRTDGDLHDEFRCAIDVARGADVGGAAGAFQQPKVDVRLHLVV